MQETIETSGTGLVLLGMNVPGVAEAAAAQVAAAEKALSLPSHPAMMLNPEQKGTHTAQAATGTIGPETAEEKKPSEKPKPNHAVRRGLRLYMRRNGAKAGRRDRVVTTCAVCHLPFLAGASGRCQCKTDRPMRRAEVA